MIDNDVYDGTDGTVPTGRRAGIAEIANANFFSEDTWSGQYPHPDARRLVRSRHPAPRSGLARSYYAKGPGDGLPADPVLAECVLDEATTASRGRLTVSCLDERVWDQTATAMIPRAVGYAGAVLDYFFRAKLEPRLRVYQQDDRLHAELTIVNRTADEGMSGAFSLHYDRSDGTRVALPLGRLELGPADSPTASSDVLTISPLPADMPASAWTLVFQGTLGAEAQAVAATRVGGMYHAVVELYRNRLGDGSYEYTFDGMLALAIGELPFLAAADRIENWAAASPEGSGTEEIRDRIMYLVYRDPDVGGATLELTPALAECNADELVAYRFQAYWGGGHHYALYLGAPTGAEVVEFVAPPDLKTLFSYTYTQLPPVRRTLAAFRGARGPMRVDVGQGFIGVRLSEGVLDPGYPDLPAPEGAPYGFRRAICAAVVWARRPSPDP